MPYLRSHPPTESETIESYGKRTFSTLVSFNGDIKELHVLADRYDGIFGYCDKEGNMICLKDCGGCHEQRGSPYKFAVSLGKHSKLDDWNSILSNSKAKAKLIELLFDEFENLVHVLQAGLTVYLSGGFQDRMRVVMLSRSGSIDTDFEQRLSCTHEEADTRVVLHTLDCLKRGIDIVYVDANDTDIVVLLLYHYKLFLGYHSNCEKRKVFVRFREYSVPIHQLYRNLPNHLVLSICLLHTLSGCDTVGFMFSKGKRVVAKAVEKWGLQEQIALLVKEIEVKDRSFCARKFSLYLQKSHRRRIR